MSLKPVSDSSNVVQFPQERYTAPTIETVREMAPLSALAASILEQRALSLTDLQGAFRSQMAQQARLLEGWLGRDVCARFSLRKTFSWVILAHIGWESGECQLRLPKTVECRSMVG